MELTAPEVRVLGCLIEKQLATPDLYPLTVNSLTAACNQSTNRMPVVRYDESTVTGALVTLREKGFTRIVYSTSNRAPKHRQVIDEVLGLEPDERAVLCLLLLRGPQTAGELKARSERLHPFADLAEVDRAITRLAERDDPLVVRLHLRPGQHQGRVAHLLGGPVDDTGEEDEPEPAPAGTRRAWDDARVAALEDRVAALEGELASLRGALVDLGLSLPSS